MVMQLHYHKITLQGFYVMAAVKEEATLTDRYQTTVPAAVRRALNLAKRDKIVYEVKGNGTVVLSRAEPAEDDPALGQFLDLLQRDVAVGNAQALTAAMRKRGRNLIKNVTIDLNAPLTDDREA